LYTAQPIIIIIEMLRLFISRFSVWSQTFEYGLRLLTPIFFWTPAVFIKPSGSCILTAYKVSDLLLLM